MKKVLIACILATGLIVGGCFLREGCDSNKTKFERNVGAATEFLEAAKGFRDKG